MTRGTGPTRSALPTSGWRNSWSWTLSRTMTTTAWLMFSPTETLMTGCWVWPGSEPPQVLKNSQCVIFKGRYEYIHNKQMQTFFSNTSYLCTGTLSIGTPSLGSIWDYTRISICNLQYKLIVTYVHCTLQLQQENVSVLFGISNADWFRMLWEPTAASNNPLRQYADVMWRFGCTLLLMW